MYATPSDFRLDDNTALFSIVLKSSDFDERLALIKMGSFFFTLLLLLVSAFHSRFRGTFNLPLRRYLAH